MLNTLRKFTIGQKEYSFKMTNRTIFKVDEVYGNYGTILYGLMNGVQYYTNAVKLIVCSCLEGITEDEIIDNCTSEQMSGIPGLAQNLYFDYIGIEEKKQERKDTEGKKEKNLETSPNLTQ